MRGFPTITVLAALITSAAVAAPVAVQSQRTARPIAVRLLSPSPGTRQPLSFLISEPAYVAVFLVQPGAGVRLLYPAVAADRLEYAGVHTDNLLGARLDDAYRVGFGPRKDAFEYLYVVASRYPMDISRFMHRSARLTNAVGFEAAHSLEPAVAMAALVDRVIGLGSDDSWDTDVYLLPPPDPLRLVGDRRPQFREITCQNGLLLRVPLAYPFLGCPGDTRVRLAPQPQPAQQPHVVASATSSGGTTASLPSPTVLPTIIGVKRVASRQAEGVRGVRYPTTITAAGGVVSVGPGPSEAPAAVEPAERMVPVFVEVPVDARYDHGFRDSRYGDRRYNVREREDALRRTSDGPVLAPTPRLSPAPQLPPSPRPLAVPPIPPSGARNGNPAALVPVQAGVAPAPATRPVRDAQPPGRVQ